MKFFLLCFFVAMAICEFVSAINPVSQMSLELQRAKNRINSINSDLKRSANTLSFTTRSKISNQKSQLLSNVNSFVNPALTQIRTDVDKAKAEGKNAEPCYDTAKSSLRTVSTTGFSGLDSCERTAQDVLNTHVNNLENLESNGNAIARELDGIAVSCFSSNQFQTASCMAVKIGAANSNIRAFESTVESAKSNANRNANDAVLSIMNCGFNVTDKVRQGTTDARIAATKCIREA